MNYREDLDKIDYIICDESHRFASEVSSSIVKETLNCRYRFGFTGTVPECPVAKMSLFGLFGLPKTYITSRELIDRGLATPVNINSLIMRYNSDDYKLFKSLNKFKVGKYAKQLTFLKEHHERNLFITNLACKISRTGNSLVLFSHTVHGKELFTMVMKSLYPDVEVENKNISGKKSFEFQQRYGVYFLNGEDNAATREKTRVILEEHEDAILIANFALLSTGVSIKKLYHLVLASPLKSYTTITQSIGRGMRLHPSKTKFSVYDIVDDLSFRGGSGVFVKQYQHRLEKSYNPEGFPIKERIITLK